MSKVFIAGHNGMVGSALCRTLKKNDIEVFTASRQELDLTNQNNVKKFFNYHKFDQVYLAAAKVGGIYSNNTYPAEFIYQNLMIQNNVIHQSYINGIKKLLFLGSSCIYPKLANQPIREGELLSGFLEPTNEPYSIAKIAGIKMCESYNRQFGTDYRSVMPTNLYGPGDNYHIENSHVIPALIRRFHEAKENNLKKIKIWGTGAPMREFLYVEDLASACLFIASLSESEYKKYTSTSNSHINVGTGKDISIKDLAEMIKEIVGYKGIISYDLSKPDGPPKKLLDVSLINKMGWRFETGLENGLNKTYKDFIANHNR